jgi:hypothetical protein
MYVSETEEVAMSHEQRTSVLPSVWRSGARSGAFRLKHTSDWPRTRKQGCLSKLGSFILLCLVVRANNE